MQQDTDEIVLGRNTVFIGVVAALVLLLAVIAGYTYLQSQEEVVQGGPASEYVVYGSGEVEVNDTFIVDASGYKEGLGQYQIVYDTYATDLTLYGAVNGEWYHATVFAPESPANTDELPFRVTPRLRPGDGIPDGFMVGKMEGPLDAPWLTVTVFVDDDFRDAYDREMLKANSSGPFPASLTEVSSGVYRDTITERNVRRFLPGVNPSDANIWFGYVDKMVPTGGLSEDDLGMLLN